MGFYLYGLKAMKRAKTVTLTDGRKVEVRHEMVFKRKPYVTGISGMMDATSCRIQNGLITAYGYAFDGLVLRGDQVLSWHGSGFWCDDCAPKWTVEGVVAGSEMARMAEQQKREMTAQMWGA